MISKISAIVLAISDDGGRTLTEIAARADLPLSTVHRLASELAAWRLLERDEDGRYRAATPLHATGQLDGDAACSGIRQSLRERAAPIMDMLFRATGARVRVGFLDGAAVAYVEKSSAHRPVSQLSPAARLPAHATAIGKVLLAFSRPCAVDSVLARGLRQYTPRTVTQPERLRWGFRTIRATRLAVCDRELDPHSCGVAAPALSAAGDVVAAIELRVRNLAQDIPVVKAPLMVATGWLSRELAPVVPVAQGRAEGRWHGPSQVVAERRHARPPLIPLDGHDDDSAGELALG